MKFVVLYDSEVTFLWETKDVAFRTFSYCALFIDWISILSNFFVFFRRYFIDTSSFSAFKCFQNCVKFIVCEVSKFSGNE